MTPQRTHRGFWWMLGLMVICTLAATSAHALIIITPKPDQPGNSPALTLSRQVVEATLSDRAAEVSVTFTYHNNSAHVLEGTYLFPLPPEAAVDKFSLEVDGEEIRAELLDAEQARREYEAIVRRVQDPALLEYAGRQLLRARIFPINPNSDATIRLYYTHPLIADFGTTNFVFPFADERWGPDGRAELNINIETQAPLKSVMSPTHDVNAQRDGAYRATITVPPGWRPMQDDMHVLCTYDTRDLSAQFLTTVDDDGNQFFMGIISPGDDPSAEVLPKDVVFCFDRSGSMQGEKIEQARAALQFCLGRLNADDRFGLLMFNDRISGHARELRPGTDGNINAARDFIRNIDADGGTNLDGAMLDAMALFEDNDRPKYLVFLTDGRPTVGITDPAEIRSRAASNNVTGVRIFTFGIGYDLNAGLLNDLAEEGRGLASYVDPGEDVEVKVSNFFRRISRPVLAGCRLEINGGVRTFDVYPGELPDVFAGTEIMVLGRFEGGGPVSAKLLGSRAGAQVNHTFNPEFEPTRGRYEFIPKLWAGRRIGYLMEEMRHHGENEELKSEVVRLSKKHGIMTPYTAFLAAPDEVRHSQLFRTQTGTTGGLDRFNIRGGRAEPAIQAGRAKSAPNVAALSDPAIARERSEQDATDRVLSNAAGRQFSKINGYWTDWELLSGNTPPTDTIHIKPYSDAYFRLGASPEIARILAVGQPLKFLWRNVLIVIDDSGADFWNKEWESLL
jgi:Ca-activated chloride channel homolog